MTLGRLRLPLVALICVAMGVALGAALAWRRTQAVLKDVADVFASGQEAVRALRASEAKDDLEAIKALHEGRLDEVSSNLESQVQDHLEELTREWPQPESVVAIVREIEAYRREHPWRPDLPGDPNSPAGLLASARILPVYESGAMVGLRVFRITPGSTWEKLGLREGDVIAEVGGVAMDSPVAAAKVLRMLSESSQYTSSRISGERVRLVSSVQSVQ